MIYQFDEIIDMLDSQILPREYPEEIIRSLENFRYRMEVIKRSCFPLISQSLMEGLAEWINSRNCLEIMAGAGVITSSLNSLGIECIATDDHSWNSETKFIRPWFEKPWTNVEKLDCISAIKKYGADIDLIICSWPDLDNSAAQALKTLRTINDKARMIYIGEWIFGCTADDEFFEIAEYASTKRFIEKVSRKFQNWMGIYDSIYIIK